MTKIDTKLDLCTFNLAQKKKKMQFLVLYTSFIRPRRSTSGSFIQNYFSAGISLGSRLQWSTLTYFVAAAIAAAATAIAAATAVTLTKGEGESFFFI